MKSLLLFSLMIAATRTFAAPPLFAVVGGPSPGLEIRLTQAGLDYAKSVGFQYLVNAAMNAKIPDFSVDCHPFNCDISNVQITQLVAPADQSSVQVSSNGLIWNSNNIAITVTAHYHMHGRIVFIPISESGTATASTQCLSFQAGAIVTDNNGQPGTAAVGSPSVDICHLDLDLDGGLISQIVDLFEGAVSKVVKDSLINIMQKELVKLFNVQANQEMAKIPITIHTSHGYGIDYSLISDPTFTNTYVQLSMKGLAYKGTEDSHMPIVAPVPTEPGDSNRMLYLILTDYVLNSFAYSMQESGLLKYTLTVEHSGNLVTTCSDQKCVGWIIPSIGNKYPNGSVEVDLTSVAAPTAQISATGVDLTAQGSISFSVRTESNAVLFAFAANMGLSVELYNVNINSNYLLTANARCTSATFDVTSTQVGPITAEMLQEVWHLAMEVAVNLVLNSLISDGVQIPQIHDITLINPILQFTTDTLIIATDVQYISS